MTTHSQRVQEAGFGELITGIRSVLQNFSTDLQQDINRNASESDCYERSLVVLDHALIVTATATAELLTTQRIEVLQGRLNEFGAAVAAIAPLTSDETTMAMVNDFIAASEAVADELLHWPRTESDDWRAAVTAAASTYRRSFGQQLAELTADLKGLRQARSRLSQELEAESTERRLTLELEFEEYGTRIAALQSTMVQLETARASTEAQLERSIQRSDEALGEMQSQFSKAQELRSREASDTRDKLVQDTNDLLAMQESAADSLVHAIREHVDAAANLVSVFAAAGTANAYSKEAKDQGDAADTWRKVAIGLGILAGVAAGAVLFGASSGDAAWQLVIGKIAIGIVVGGLASYAASQSARHRRREEAARHLELNLATFGPLADELDEEALNTARAELVSAMLRREDSASANGRDSETIGDSQINLLQRLIDTVLKQR